MELPPKKPSLSFGARSQHRLNYLERDEIRADAEARRKARFEQARSAVRPFVPAHKVDVAAMTLYLLRDAYPARRITRSMVLDRIRKTYGKDAV